MATQTALVGIGSNLSWHGMPPDELATVAVRVLNRFGAAAMSPLYDSPSWPDASKPAYVNAVATLQTELPPGFLLAVCQGIEAAFGRQRDPHDRNAPRTLDLDLLAMGDLVLKTETLTLPHPRLAERDFVLAPLADIAPNWRHPLSGVGAAALLKRLPDRTVRRRSCA